MRTIIAALLWLFPTLAAAQSSSPKADADALFHDGKQLLAGGEVDKACAKFEASLALLDQLGVRLNLADCHELQGRTATAHQEFATAASLADLRGDPRARFAHQRANGLSARLVKLQLAISAADQIPDLAVQLNGKAIPYTSIAVPTAVDPSHYVIDVSAPGRQTWSTRVDVSQPGRTVTVDVPKLAAMPVGPGAGPAIVAEPHDHPSDADNRRYRRRVLGFGIGAGGLVATATGLVLGLQARSKWDSASAHCSATNVCDEAGATINRDARKLGNVGTVVGAVGVAALVAGAAIYFTAPAARSVTEHARIDVVPMGRVGVAVVGRF